MNLEVLYFDGCPSHEALMDRLRFADGPGRRGRAHGRRALAQTGAGGAGRVVQKALLMNSSVGFALGKAVSLPGLASVKRGRNTVPCESRPW